MRLFAILAVVCCLIVVYSAPGDRPNKVTDRDLDKMKIKELKKFLDDRGIACPGCTQKEDLLAKAKAHKDTPVSKRTRTDQLKNADMDALTFAEAWKVKTRQLCATESRGAERHQAVCDAVSDAVHNQFSTMVVGLAKGLGKNQDKIKDISLGDPYVRAGEMNIKKSVKWALEGGVTDEKEIKDQLQKDVTQWLMDTAMENDRNMKFQGMDMDEIIRQMQKEGKMPPDVAGAAGTSGAGASKSKPSKAKPSTPPRNSERGNRPQRPTKSDDAHDEL